MSAFERVVAGIDFRSGGDDAIALARVLAPQASLVLAHAYSLGASETVARLIEWDDACREGAVQMLAERRDRAGVDAELEVVADPSAARALQGMAVRHAADLIVVGSAHHGRFGRVLLGDVGRSLVQHAPCPVAIAPRAFAGERPAVVGVGFDGSPEAEAALDLAALIARFNGARLEILMVVGEPVPTTPSVYDWSAYLDEQRRVAAELLERETARHEGATGTVLEGDAAHELAERSPRLDLLVVGSRRWGPARRVLLGSTSDRLAHSAACPLILTPRARVAEPAVAPAR